MNEGHFVSVEFKENSEYSPNKFGEKIAKKIEKFDQNNILNITAFLGTVLEDLPKFHNPFVTKRIAEMKIDVAQNLVSSAILSKNLHSFDI